MPLKFGNIKYKSAKGFTVYSHKTYPGSDLEIKPKPQSRLVFWVDRLILAVIALVILGIMVSVINYAINLPVR